MLSRRLSETLMGLSRCSSVLLSYSTFLGRLAIGKITSGEFHIDKEVVVATPGAAVRPARITKIYRFKGTEKVETEQAGVGEIVAVAGMESITIGETLTDPITPTAP